MSIMLICVMCSIWTLTICDLLLFCHLLSCCVFCVGLYLNIGYVFFHVLGAHVLMLPYCVFYRLSIICHLLSIVVCCLLLGYYYLCSNLIGKALLLGCCVLLYFLLFYCIGGLKLCYFIVGLHLNIVCSCSLFCVGMMCVDAIGMLLSMLCFARLSCLSSLLSLLLGFFVGPYALCLLLGWGFDLLQTVEYI